MPLPCYFTNKVHLAYRVYVGKYVKGDKKLGHLTVRQCSYCENIFTKSQENMGHHIKVCAAKEGITYYFDNGDIFVFQDNLKYLGNAPFTVYFYFETITGETVFFDPKMFVMRYCQIYSFHPRLNLEKIVIFRSFQQSAKEIYDLSHFRQERVAFFDRMTFYHLKDAASAVLAREKSTSLAELFSVELKFTIDTLNDWFSNTIKLKFLNVNYIKKQLFIKENPTVPSKTIFSICGFLLEYMQEENINDGMIL